MEKIVEDLKPIGVVDDRRLNAKRNDNVVDIASVVLTFNRQKLPE